MQAAAARQTVGALYLASRVGAKGAKFGGVIPANPKAGIAKAADLTGRKVIGLSHQSAGAYLFQAFAL